MEILGRCIISVATAYFNCTCKLRCQNEYWYTRMAEHQATTAAEPAKTLGARDKKTGGADTPPVKFEELINSHSYITLLVQRTLDILPSLERQAFLLGSV